MANLRGKNADETANLILTKGEGGKIYDGNDELYLDLSEELKDKASLSGGPPMTGKTIVDSEFLGGIINGARIMSDTRYVDSSNPGVFDLWDAPSGTRYAAEVTVMATHNNQTVYGFRKYLIVAKDGNPVSTIVHDDNSSGMTYSLYKDGDILKLEVGRTSSPAIHNTHVIAIGTAPFFIDFDQSKGEMG